MALPDDQEDNEDRPSGPLLPPEDRLWRHPSELASHPLDPGSAPHPISGPPPPPSREQLGRGSRRGLLVLACLAGATMLTGALWVAWPRQTPEPAITSAYVPVDDPAATLPNAAATLPATAATTRTGNGLFGVLPPLTPADPTPSPGRLGVQVIDRTISLVGLPPLTTAQVVEVEPASAAERAGLLPGDLISAVDSRYVGSADDLIREVTRHRPGDHVEVTVIRRGERHTFEVRLGH